MRGVSPDGRTRVAASRRSHKGSARWLLAGLLVLIVGCTDGQAPETPSPFLAGAPWVAGPAAPVALTEVAAAAHEGQIWVAGGLRADGSASDRVYLFDPKTNRWEDGPRLPRPIHHAALVSDGFALWLVGGYEGSGFNTPTATVLLIFDSEGEWVEEFPLPEPRAAGAAASSGAGVLYAGGIGRGGLSADVFMQVEHGWALIGQLSKAREHLAAASDGEGRTIFLGGRVGGLDGNLPTVDLVESRNLLGGPDRIGAIGDLPTARGGVAAFWWPSLGACLVGGESPDGTNAEVECITPDGRQTRLSSLAVARHGLGAVVLDGSAWTLLGGPAPGLFTSDVAETLRLP